MKSYLSCPDYIGQNRAIAVFNYSEHPKRLKLSESNMPADSSGLLHLLQKVGNVIEIAPHDAVLIIEGHYKNEWF